MNWIPIESSERPELDERVLAWLVDNYGLLVQYRTVDTRYGDLLNRYGDFWVDGAGFYWENGNVTHWARIEPPQETR
jgi:hypothetical protein